MANTKRKCKQCKQFIPVDKGVKINTGFFCSIESAMVYAREKASKKKLADQAKADRDERAELKKRKESIKTKPELTREAQRAFNRFIRLRDCDKACISCGRSESEVEIFTGGKWDCGHFLGVGARPELRFEPKNAYRQCKSCNGGSGKYAKKSSTVAEEYERRLRERVGDDTVDWLKGPHPAANHTHDDLRAIKAKYNKLANDLQKTFN